MQVIGRDGGWLQVEYADPRRSHDGLTGWVYGRFLHRADGPPTRAHALLLRDGGLRDGIPRAPAPAPP